MIILSFSMSLFRRSQQGYSHHLLYLLLLSMIGLVIGLIGYLSTQTLWAKPMAVEISGWQPTTSLPEELAVQNAVVHQDIFYTIGGKKRDGNPTTTIYGAQIAADGTLGSWDVKGQLPIPLYLHTTVIANDALFVIGGWDGGKPVNKVWRATFDPNGNVVGWSGEDAIQPYPIALTLHDAAFIDGYIYVVGGYDGFAERPLREIYAARVTSAGIGNWERVGDLPIPLYRHAVAGLNGKLYITGGFDENRRGVDTVQYTQVNGTSPIGVWQNALPLPNTTYYHQALIHDGRLVVLGGQNNNTIFSDVYSYLLDSNGIPGTRRVEAVLPEQRYRFGAAAAMRFGSEYLFMASGLHTNDNDYQSTVYHSTVPLPPTSTATPTPTPTITPTPTSTPTPLPPLVLAMHNEPNSWIGPGDEVVYTIAYTNQSSDILEGVEIASIIPRGVELVTNSVRSGTGNVIISGEGPGSTLAWQMATISANARGEVAYTVRRPLPPTPSARLALAIEVSAPANVAATEEVTYTLTISNRSPIALNNLLITNTIPTGASYLRGGDVPPTNGTVEWRLPTLDADSATNVAYTVSAETTLVNYAYRVTTLEGVKARGRVVAVTLVDGQLPQQGDGFTLINRGATGTWGVGGANQYSRSNITQNPSFLIYLPLIQQD